MSEMIQSNIDNLADVTGGYGARSWKTVSSVPRGYLPIRTKPEATDDSEIPNARLGEGDKVQITGAVVNGPSPTGTTKYVWVYAPRYEISGFVDAAYLTCF